MDQRVAEGDSALEALRRMFDVELRFLASPTNDAGMLAEAFHPDVVVHEPRSLPYAGDWRGLDGIAALLRRMSELWSDIAVADMDAARSGDTVFMACRLRLVARAGGATLERPFAEVLRFRDGLLLDGTPFYHDTAEITALLDAAA